MTFKKAVIDTLRDNRLSTINFGYRGSFVYQSGYHDIARLVEDGHIRFEYSGGGNNSFAAATPAGEAHVWSVNRDIARLGPNDQIVIRGDLASAGRGTSVHEATHALQDYQRLHDPDRLGSGFSAEQAEGAAHIADWMGRFLWGWPRANDQGNTHGTIALARSIADDLLEGRIGPIVSPGLAGQLDTYARYSIGSRHRYAFHGFF